MARSIQQILENFFYAANPLLLVLAFVLCSIYVNNVIIKFRLNQFDNALTQISNKENTGHTLNMLSRFHLIRQRRQSQEEMESDLHQEIRFQTVAQKDLFQKQPVSLTSADAIVLKVIKGVRFLLGKKQETLQKGENMVELEQAYFYERIRNYRKAKQMYEKALFKGNLSENLNSTILLHHGFCNGLLGNYGSAMVSLGEITGNENLFGTENWKIAHKLKDEIKDIQMEYEKVQEREKSGLVKGKQMYLLGNYKGAITHLQKKNMAETKTREEIEEGLFLLGRAYENLGMSEKAIGYYRSLLKQDHRSKWAKKANRRLYVMGEFYTENKKLSQVAAANSKFFGDTALIEKLKVYKKIDSTSKQLDTDTTLKKPSLKLELDKSVKDTAPVVTLGEEPLKPDTAEKESATVAQAEPLDKNTRKIFNFLEDLRVPEKALSYKESLEDVKAVFQEEKKPIPPENKKEPLTDPVRTREIFSVITIRSGELKYIFKKWKQKELVWGGKMNVRILITSSGAVSEVEIVHSDKGMSHPVFIKDLIRIIKKWRFRPMDKDAPLVSITFPITFKTGGKKRAKYQP